MKRQEEILVTIVTISYNQAEFLEEAIKSVLSQTYKNIEYIVFDGGSSDGSVDIIEKYRNSIKEVHIGPDGGAAAALNSAFSLANGDFHAYINSDDLLVPDAVETWVRYFTENPDIDIVYGDIDIIDKNGLPTTLPGRRVKTFLSGPVNRLLYSAGASAIPQQASCCRASVFECVGGFEESNRSCWDGEFFVDAFILGAKAKRIPKVLAKFRMHDESISATNRNEQERRVDHARMKEKWKRSGFLAPVYINKVLVLYVKAYRLFRYMVRGSSNG